MGPLNRAKTESEEMVTGLLRLRRIVSSPLDGLSIGGNTVRTLISP